MTATATVSPSTVLIDPAVENPVTVRTTFSTCVTRLEITAEFGSHTAGLISTEIGEETTNTSTFHFDLGQPAGTWYIKATGYLCSDRTQFFDTGHIATFNVKSVTPTVSVSKSSVVLYGTGRSSESVTVTSDPDLILIDPTIELVRPNGGTFKTASFSGRPATYGHTFTFPYNTELGRWHVRVTGLDPYEPSTRIHLDRIAEFELVGNVYVSTFNAHPEPLGPDGKMTVSGRAMMVLGWYTQTTEHYVPCTNSGVTIYFRADGQPDAHPIGTTETSNTGWFSRSFHQRHSGTWYASPGCGNFYRQRLSKGDHVTVESARRTAFTRFNASPEPVSYGRDVSTSGYLWYRRAGHWHHFAHAKVRLYFRYRGKTHLHYMGTTYTSKTGHFHRHFRDFHSGTWYARFPGVSTKLYKTSWSNGDYVRVSKTRATAFTRFKVSGLNDTVVHIHGYLWYYRSGHWHHFKHAKVRLYFRYKGKTKLHYRCTTHTSNTGYFHLPCRNTYYDGTWYARFPGKKGSPYKVSWSKGYELDS